MITFDALIAVVWGIFLGMSIASGGRDLRVGAGRTTCVLGFVCLLALRPVRQLVQRSAAGERCFEARSKALSWMRRAQGGAEPAGPLTLASGFESVQTYSSSRAPGWRLYVTRVLQGLV